MFSVFGGGGRGGRGRLQFLVMRLGILVVMLIVAFAGHSGSAKSYLVVRAVLVAAVVVLVGRGAYRRRRQTGAPIGGRSGYPMGEQAAPGWGVAAGPPRVAPSTQPETAIDWSGDGPSGDGPSGDGPSGDRWAMPPAARHPDLTPATPVFPPAGGAATDPAGGTASAPVEPPPG